MSRHVVRGDWEELAQLFKTFKTLFLLHGCKSVTLSICEEHTNSLLGKVMDEKWRKVTGTD